VKEKFSRYGM